MSIKPTDDDLALLNEKIDVLLSEITELKNSRSINTSFSDLNQKSLLTVEEAARLYPVSKWFLYKGTSSYEIPHHKIKSKVFFKKNEIEAYFENSSTHFIN